MLRMTTSTEVQTGGEGWTATDDSFGARLALVRQRMGWNITQAARECGLGSESWRLWEQAGRMPVRLTTICMAIATKTGCDYLWLCHGPTRGQVHRSAYRRGPRVVATVRSPEALPQPITPAMPTRPVRQTRPIVGGSIRPLAPSVL